MKRFNNKILIITLIVLAGAFVLTKMFRSPARETNLDTDVFSIDTAKVTAINLYPVSDGRKEIKLVTDGKNWRVTRDQITSSAETYPMNTLLRTIAELKPERIVTRKKEKWDNYSVGDTTAIQVIAFSGKEELLNLWIGKESGGQTYVRSDDEDNVYAVDGNLRVTFNKKFSDWRDKSFLRLSKEQIARITFQYPADSGFVAEKKNNIWMIGNEKADSVKIENYLNKVRSKDIAEFADDFKPAKNPEVMVTFESQADSLATIKAWKPAFYQWVFTSTQQPDTYFSDNTLLIARELLPGRKELLP